MANYAVHANPTRLEQLCSTSEEWHGCYGGHTVLVSVVDITHGCRPAQSACWRLSAWGNDDHGLYRDYEADEAAAKRDYAQLVASPVTHAECLALGMAPF